MKLVSIMSTAVFLVVLIFLFIFNPVSYTTFPNVLNVSAQTCVQPPSGMISWWPGDDNATDIQGANNGTLQNGATFAPGKVGQAFSFPGTTGNRVDLGSSGSLKTPQFTADAWVKPTGTGAGSSGDSIGAIIFSNDERSTVVAYDLLHVPSTGKFSLRAGYTDGSVSVLFSAGTFPINQFYHVAATFDGSALRLYVNGNLEASDTTVAGKVITYGTGPIVIGAHSAVFGGDRPFRGLIDEVEVFSRALSASEIQAIFAAGSAGKCPPPPPPVFTSQWDGSSGLLPDQVCPAWLVFDTASPENPTLSNGRFVISRDSTGEGMGAIQQPGTGFPLSGLVFTFPAVIEARMRLVSGTAFDPARSPAEIVFNTAFDVSNMLGIDHDRIFLLIGDLSVGAQAFVDTNDAFHTYRIVLEASGAVKVFYDGTLTLTGSMISGGGAVHIRFGSSSSFAIGTSEWEFVRHTASTVICAPADTTPPDTTITSDVDGNGDPVANGGSTLSTSITFVFAGTDDVAVASFECSLDGADFSACTSPKTYTSMIVGSHTFQVRTIDTSGNIDLTPTSLTWTILTPAQAIQNLINPVKSFNLQQGIENSLDAKLQNAQNALTAAMGGDGVTACNQLGALINEIQAQSGNKLSVAQANELITAINQIKVALGCS